ncbi:biotin--[acetyl-CoA-carboxylase] ligase [Methylovorus mays]|uniref:biotin--[acetyl-CoA-carboxylase] ligase n=1 Tax=Methylovorus mays TaxID=184077 RepID=UPI001E4C93DC|nr:biotin--[acetyl-CoA-carboxylase] ligase [Methylovorus mays]MCB5207608.1 biotin--[acetyl-CoA-carboxylase] ligase [Methylovorus mays]
MTNPLTFPILHRLADGSFHSGEALAAHFKVSRSTVWNAVKHAETLGVEIFSVRGKGYRLSQPLDLLRADRILAALGPASNAVQLFVHDQLDSTNRWLMQQAANGAVHLSCAVTSHQTQGRGRRGRVWQSALGNSLTFSLLWRFESGAAALSGLSLAVGLALGQAFAEMGVVVGLKWPNDVLVEYRKLAGILIELQGDMEGPSAAVIGVGINLRLPERMLAQIDQAAIDLQSLKAAPVEASMVLGIVLKHMLQVIGRFEREGFAALVPDWQAMHVYHQQPVRLLMPDATERHGVVAGVAEDGSLLVTTEAGEQRFTSGEISLRKAVA